MKKKVPVEQTLDDLICSKHRQPIRGICIDKHCTQRYRYICALCKVSHKYDQTEYLDEVLNWDYISKYKFKRMIDALEDRKAKRAHKIDEIEKKITKSFETLKESLIMIIEEKKKNLISSLKDQAITGCKEEILLMQKVFKCKKKAQKVFKRFDPENFLRESLDPHIDNYHEIRNLETKFNEVQKLPLITLPLFTQDCMRAQEELQESIPKCLDQFFKRDDFKKAKKIMFSFPKFTLDEDHIKISNLQYYKNSKEDGDETQMETDFAVLSESGSSEGELGFERLILLQYDEANEVLYTQSASKKLVVLNGLEQKSMQFSYPINDEITCSLICADKQKFYIGTQNGELYVYESATQNIQKLYEFGSRITGIAMTSNPFWLTITSDKMLFFLDFTKDPALFMTFDLLYPISSVVYVPTKDIFVIGFSNGKIACWSCKEKTELSNKLMASDGIKQLMLSEDEKTLFSCSEDGYVCLWKVVGTALSLLKVIKINSPLLPPDLLPLYQYNLLIIKEDWLLKVFRINDGKLLKKLHLRVYQDYKMLYDKKKAILNLYKTEY